MSYSVKCGFKIKVVQFYENLFKCKDVNTLADNENYWNEFFLLKVNHQALHQVINNIGDQNLNKYKTLINLIFAQGVSNLNSNNKIKDFNAFLTLYSLSRCILNKSKKIDAFNLLIGKNDLDIKIKSLNKKLIDLLASDNSIDFKSFILKFYLSFICVYDDINENYVLFHLLSDEFFDILISLISNKFTRQSLGKLIILIFSLILNYKNYDHNNLFQTRLSVLEDEITLNGFIQIISTSFLQYINKFEFDKEQANSQNLLQTLTSLVGNIFVDETKSFEIHNFDYEFDNLILLAFYNTINLNRNFITLLTNSNSDDLVKNEDEPNLVLDNNPRLPSNLIINFLEYCSIVMLSSKKYETISTARLCFIILTCISEDQYANSILHDSTNSFKIKIHRTQLRHRKLNEDLLKLNKPLAFSILDLMIEFISSNLRKEFLIDLYFFCVNIILKLLCYQIKCKIRFSYCWQNLWHALISLLKFLIVNEQILLIKRKYDILLLANNVVNLLNLFITFGDTFLDSLNTYDELYYELIRMHNVFDQLYDLAKKYKSSDKKIYKESGKKLLNFLVNIKSIILHFNEKIEEYKNDNSLVTLTEEEVLNIVKNNYDTLSLKVQDGIAIYENYNPFSSTEKHFFKKIFLRVILDIRNNILDDLDQINKDQQKVLNNIIQT